MVNNVRQRQKTELWNYGILSIEKKRIPRAVEIFLNRIAAPKRCNAGLCVRRNQNPFRQSQIAIAALKKEKGAPQQDSDRSIDRFARRKNRRNDRRHFSCINDVGNMREHQCRVMTFDMFCYDS
jgi:hypothetical protein